MRCIAATFLLIAASGTFGRADDAPRWPDDEPHPLTPVLRLAEKAHERITRDVEDYTCRIVRRERIGGKLRPYEFIDAKIRHASDSGSDSDNGNGNDDPLSVYLKFLKPRSVAGREVLFLEGRNAGKLLVRRGGTRLAYVTTYLAPTSDLAMQDNRYPITEIGVHRLIERLTEVMQEDMKFGECIVEQFADAKVAGRTCTRIVVEHPTKRDHFRFHRALVFMDDERQIPIAYASYWWPREEGGKPRLLEEYIYTDMKLNVGLTDGDFDRDNPEYGFLRKERTSAAR